MSTNRTSQELAQLWFDALAALTKHAERFAGGHTASDFALVLGLSQQELDQWTAATARHRGHAGR